MATHVVKKCRSCEAPIIFLKTQAGKWMPVDADSVDQTIECTYDGKVHSSHFDTCGNAAAHRQKKVPKAKQLELGVDDGTVPF